MPDLAELVDVLREQERHAPDADAVRRRVAQALATERPNPRRWLLPVAAVVAVALVAVGVTLLAGGGRDRSTPPGRMSTAPTAPMSTVPSAPRPTGGTATAVHEPWPHPLRWSFAVGNVPGYSIYREQCSPEDQMARVTVPGANKDIGGIDVYPDRVRPDDLDRVRRPQSVSVNGQPATFGRVGGETVLLWQVDGQAWAEVSGDWPASQRDELVRIARAVRPADAPVRMNLRIGWLPAGLVATNSTFYDAAHTGPYFAVEFGDGQAGTAMTISRGQDVQSSQPGSAFHRNATVNGRPAEYETGSFGASLAVRYADGSVVLVDVPKDHAARYDRATLFRIAGHLTPAGTWSRPSTWIPSSAGLPH